MNKLIYILGGLAVGAGIGFLIGQKVSNDACEAKIRDEVLDVKKKFDQEVETRVQTELKRKEKDSEEPAKAEEKEENGPVMKEMKPEMTSDQIQYRKITNTYAGGNSQEDEIRKMAAGLKPRIISSDEVGEHEEYGAPIEFVYYADGVLVDDNDDEVEEKEYKEIIGTEWVDFMKTHDCCSIVNDRRKVYYEITADPSSWEEVRQNRPFLRQ